MVRVTLLLAGVSAYAQAPCATEAYRRYDYVIGEWAVARDSKPAGNVRYRKAVHGCAIVEDYSAPGGVSRKGLLFYDPNASRWEIVVAGTDGLLEGVETAPGVFAAGGDEFQLAQADEGFSIAMKGGWRQVYVRAPFPVVDSSGPRHCDSVEQRQFDFWIGKWEVFNPRGALAGTNHIYSAAKGCALVENWTSAIGLSTGISLNYWDPKRVAWRQVWVAPGGAIRIEGKWDGAALRFGSPVSRLTFTPNQDGSIRQYWEQATAGGRTWSVAFDGTYRRATERSKEELLAELDASEQATLKLFEGVAESQARFRQADGRWSLAEILDHLNATETMFLQNARKLSEDKHTKSVSGFEPGPIERLLAAVIANRNQRLNAPEPLLPKEAARPFAESLAEFRRRRQETKAFVRIAELRGARAVHPLGQTNLDAYQWMFTLAAHNRRHLEQAAEVMADPRYPGGADGLRRWSGLWQGAGKFNGKDVDIELSLKEQLGGKFNELNINIKTGPGTTFLGRAMYGSDDRASWSDSNGNAYPVVGRWDGGKFIAEWGDPVRGRSTYWVDTEGQLEVVDEVKRADGSYFGFGKYKLKRVPVNPSSVRDIRQTNVVDANSMTARVTNLAVGAKEELAAQDRDAFYFVEAGSGMLEAGSQQIPVQAGTIIHVQGGVVRRFHSIAHALRVLVVMPR